MPLRPPSRAVKQIMLHVLFLPPLTVVAMRPVSLPPAVQIPGQVAMSRQQLKHPMAPSLPPLLDSLFDVPQRWSEAQVLLVLSHGKPRPML